MHNRIKHELNMDLYLNLFDDEPILRSEIHRLELKVAKAIVDFKRKGVKSDYTTDKAFLDGSLLVLQWMQEELKRMLRDGESRKSNE